MKGQSWALSTLPVSSGAISWVALRMALNLTAGVYWRKDWLLGRTIPMSSGAQGILWDLSSRKNSLVFLLQGGFQPPPKKR